MDDGSSDPAASGKGSVDGTRPNKDKRRAAAVVVMASFVSVDATVMIDDVAPLGADVITDELTDNAAVDVDVDVTVEEEEAVDTMVPVTDAICAADIAIGMVLLRAFHGDVAADDVPLLAAATAAATPTGVVVDTTNGVGAAVAADGVAGTDGALLLLKEPR